MFTLLSQFNWVDWLIVGMIFISTIVSFSRGFVIELISLLSWIGAFILALLYTDGVADFLRQHFSGITMQYAVVFIGIMAITLIIGKLIGFTIRSFISAVGLGMLDRLLGMAFGVVRGTIAVLVLILLIDRLDISQRPDWTASILVPHAKIVLHGMNGIFDVAMGN